MQDNRIGSKSEAVVHLDSRWYFVTYFIKKLEEKESTGVDYPLVSTSITYTIFMKEVAIECIVQSFS